MTGECDVVQNVEIVAESALAAQDGAYRYPLGLIDFELRCENLGESATVTFYFDDDYDTSGWTFRKFDDQRVGYRSIFDIVTFGESVVNGSLVTTASYTLTDGGPNDVDGATNGVIDDPAGPATADFGSPPPALAFTGPTDAQNLALAGLLLAIFGIGLQASSRSRTRSTRP